MAHPVLTPTGAPANLVVIAVTAVLALSAVAYRPVWRLSRNVVTIVHEGGHALVAVLAGRRMEGIRLHSDTSGVAISRGRPTGPGMVATTAFGYPAPALVGLGCAGLLAAGRVAALLWLGIVLLAATLLLVRNAFGVLSVTVTGLLLVGVTVLAADPVRTAFGYLVTWFLLFGAVRPVTELHRKRRHGQARQSDADQLGRLTGLPGQFWVAVFGLVALACLVAGGALLLGLPWR